MNLKAQTPIGNGLIVNQVKRYEAGSAQPSIDGLKKLARAFSVSTDWLLFEDAERGTDEGLRLQFEAMSQLTPEEKDVARAVLEGLLLKHAAHQWTRPAAAKPDQAAHSSPAPAKTAAAKTRRKTSSAAHR